MHTLMELHTLGGLRLEGTDFTRPKPLLLVCYLTIEGPRSRRVLADLFFSDVKDPRDSLSTAVRQLRDVDGVLAEDGDKLGSSVDSDAARLIDAFDSGLLDPAVEMYEGPFLAGLDLELGEELEEWVFTTREYLAANVRLAHIRLAEAAVRRGTPAAARRHAEAALELDEAPPLEPEWFPRLHAALVAGGSPRAAAVRERAEEFGVPLIQRPPEVGVMGTRSIRAAEPSTPTNLPEASSVFVGRAYERLEIGRFLTGGAARLLTLHGPGGVGKSRLALRAARDQLESSHFAGGVFWVPLESSTQEEQIPEAIGVALQVDVGHAGDPWKSLASALSDRHCLLVLDGFEHLERGAPALQALMGACPRARVLVTSRRRLNLAEEHVLSISGLELPDPRHPPDRALAADAMRLLVQRGKKADLGFELTHADIQEAARLCRLLQGSPLAIELAMAWLRAMPIARIRNEIEADLDFLESPTRTGDQGHESLRAVFERSWTLLDERERELLPKLSVFVDGFRREAASDVADATLPALLKLVDASLLIAGADGRFGLHPLVHQFCAELLAESPEDRAAARDAHAEHYRALAAEHLIHMYTPQEGEALAAIDAELANIMAGWKRLLEVHARHRREFPTDLAVFFDRSGKVREGVRFFRDAARKLERGAENGSRTLAEVLANHAWFQYRSGAYSQAQELAETAMSLDPDDGPATMVAANVLGSVLVGWERTEEALPHFERAIELATRLDRPERATMYLISLARAKWLSGDARGAKHDFATSIRLSEEHAYPFSRVLAWNNLAVILEDEGDLDTALVVYEDALQLARKCGYVRMVPILLVGAAEASIEGGRVAAARTYLDAVEATGNAARDRALHTLLLDIRGRILAAEGHADAAEDTFQEALRLAWQQPHDRLHIKILVHAAELLASQGRRSEARYILMRIRSKPGQHGAVARRIAKLVRTMVPESPGSHDETRPPHWLARELEAPDDDGDDGPA